MTGWYDINDLHIDTIVDDRAQTLASADYVASLVQSEIDEGIPAEKIIVGGFSQGGVVALAASLRSKHKLAGCAALSTYLAMRDDYPDVLGPHAKEIPVFLAHGTADMVLNYEYGTMTAAKLDTMVWILFKSSKLSREILLLARATTPFFFFPFSLQD